ncbi:MAG TPA: GNAT family N-acetyltransferase [Burkholderiaceae bacterium]|nr:GNAT family N-acetyltransferase [Burkholderiaceae bacterium]
MTDSEAHSIVRTRYAEFGCTAPPDEIEGNAHHTPAGFVIVRPMRQRPAAMTPQGTALIQGPEPCIEWLWIHPAQRGQGAGRQLVRDAVRRYGQLSDVLALCHGADRVRLFRSCGFRVEASVGDWHGMRWMCSHPVAAALRRAW